MSRSEAVENIRAEPPLLACVVVHMYMYMSTLPLSPMLYNNPDLMMD